SNVGNAAYPVKTSGSLRPGFQSRGRKRRPPASGYVRSSSKRRKRVTKDAAFSSRTEFGWVNAVIEPLDELMLTSRYGLPGVLCTNRSGLTRSTELAPEAN